MVILPSATPAAETCASTYVFTAFWEGNNTSLVLVLPKSVAVLLFTLASAPKLVKAAAAVVAPVPPFAIAISVALQVPEVIVPIVFKFDREVNVVFVVAVIFPAVDAVVALPVTFPVQLPIKLGAVKSLLNVFTPAIVCAPVEIKPGFVPFAAVNVKEVPLIVPPAAYEVVDV